MATVGLKYPVYAPLTEAAGAATYANGKVLGKAMTASASYEKSDVKLYADDGLVATDTGFTGGTISVGIFDMLLTDRAKLLGHTELTESAVGFTANASDVAPYVGFGFYGKKTGGKWRAIWYSKVQFGEPNDELETKGESTVYKTPTLEGSLMQDVTGKWVEVQDFDTETAAITFLNTKADIKNEE